MAITENPGDYQVLAPLFEPGYHFVQKVDHGQVTPKAEELAAYADPRGILRAGMVPASQISYEISESLKELVSAENFRRASGGIDIGFAIIIGQVVASTKSCICLIGFEGHDVIDLPTDQLEQVGGGYKTPTKVFLPLYAGDKWITDKKDIAIEAGREYFKRSPENQILDVLPSVNPPLDCLSHEKPIFPKTATFPIIDTASDIIQTKGGASFISYVAIDKPLFRDVIFINSAFVAQGPFFGNILKVSIVAPYSTPKTVIFRYQFVNVNPPDTTPLFQWRLSETYGIVPEKFEATPSSLSLSQEEKTRDLIESQAEKAHFVYNLNDGGPDITERFPQSPVKKGYSLALAKAKIDPTSPFFDRDFKAQIIPLKKNSFFTQSRTEQKSIFVLQEQFESITGPNGSGITRVITDRSYVSPFLDLDLSQNARLGVEYSIRTHAKGPISLDRFTLLAGTRPASVSISAYRDPCIDAIVVDYIDFETVSERFFYDNDWATAGQVPPTSKLKSFLIGEVPQRTSGRTAIVPFQEPLSASSIGNGTISIEAGALPIGIVMNTAPVSTDPKQSPVLQLFEGDDTSGDPSYEIAVPQSETAGLSIVPIPSLRFKKYKIDPSGGSPVSLVGSKIAYLEKPDSAKATITLNEITKLQIDELKAEEFPLKSVSVSACSMSKFGHAGMAFEREGRIDFAYRSSNHQPWTPVRDVIQRIPEDFINGVSSAKASLSFPTAAVPFLLSDVELANFYLFYVYKNRLLMKTVPADIFVRSPSIDDDPRYALVDEADLIGKMHALIPVIVYDGGMADPTVEIKADIAFNAIAGDFTPPTTTTDSDLPQIGTHSAVYTLSGNIFSFIEANQRIRLMGSGDRGLTWNNILPDDFFFYPQLIKGSPVRLSPEGTEGVSPSCYYYSGTKNIIFVFVVESSILLMNIPEHILIQEPDAVAASLSEIVPTVIYGDVSDDMKQRGIVAQPSVLERKESLKDEFNEKVASHRMAISSTQFGHLRLFFLDQNKRLQSLISSDSGLSWRSEDQYIADRV